MLYSMVNLEPRPERELQLLPSSRAEPHPSSSSERFALARDEELAFTDTELDELFSLVDMKTQQIFMCKHVSLQRLYIVYNIQCLKEGIMNHNFPCTPEGGKISQLNPTGCMAKVY